MKLVELPSRLEGSGKIEPFEATRIENSQNATTIGFQHLRCVAVGRADPLRPVASHVDLLGNCQGVVDLDAEVAHCAFDLGMAQ